ncbi:conserved hypothetical protein [Candidatus Nitrotoga sp. M5]|nr:conserved hypothetical protein [Candidatus Nitrotoga sp. M5]
MTKYKSRPDHIHTPCDCRGLRTVYLDGVELKNCFFADTRRGIADVYLQPLRLDKFKKRALTERLRGVVTVVFI